MLWEKTIINMMADGIDTFVELGPKTVLRGLIGKISGDVKALNVEDEKSLKETIALLI